MGRYLLQKIKELTVEILNADANGKDARYLQGQLAICNEILDLYYSTDERY